jgi:hypothetical protein
MRRIVRQYARQKAIQNEMVSMIREGMRADSLTAAGSATHQQ